MIKLRVDAVRIESHRITLELNEENGEHQPGTDVWYRVRNEHNSAALTITVRNNDPLFNQFKESPVGAIFTLSRS